jgi:excisionase family DNA binding protein
MPPTADTQTAILLTLKQLCTLLATTSATVTRLRAAGKLPQALRLGGQLRWNAAELRAWIAAGMPARAEWEARQKSRARP